MFKDKNKAQGANFQESIGRNTVINGNLESENDIRMDGSITGDLATTAKVVMGKESRVEGSLSCKNADISGTITGSVTVEGVLNLKPTGVIEGEVVAGSLNIMPGGRMEATCRIGAPQDSKLTIAKSNGKKVKSA